MLLSRIPELDELDSQIDRLQSGIDRRISILNTVGWKIPSRRLLEKSLKNGINVKCVIDNRTIGMARFVSDGGYAGLLMDVIVIPSYQKMGYGKLLVDSLLNYLKKQLKNGEEMMIQLLSAPGKQSFYNLFGFKVKKEVAQDGMYMWLKNMWYNLIKRYDIKG